MVYVRDPLGLDFTLTGHLTVALLAANSSRFLLQVGASRRSAVAAATGGGRG